MMNFNYNAVFTTNINEYKLLRSNNDALNWDFKIQNCKIINNLAFGKVYYIFYENKLIAFKLIAFSINKKEYLLETPNGLMWVNLDYYRVFFSKEHYFEYLEEKKSPIIYGYSQTYLHNIVQFTLHKNYPTFVELKTSYVWDKDLAKPKETCSRIYDILYTENGFVVYYNLYGSKAYPSYQECLQANLDGMEICEFGEEETTIHFHIKTETKPKIHVLRFVED